MGSEWNGKGKHLGAALLTLVMLSLVPVSVSYAQNLNGNMQKKAEKLIDVADSASDKVENLIALIYSNQTAIHTITVAGLFDELEANRSLFETWGLGNLTDAHNALEEGIFTEAIANATQSLSIGREVIKALNNILADSEVERGRLVYGQGLIEAMKRALNKIERLREIPELPEDIQDLLNESETYLNIEEARIWLSQGRVNETAHNKTQANKLISEAHRYLKEMAKQQNTRRIQNYMRIMEKFCNRAEEELQGAEQLQARLQNEVRNIIQLAQGDLEDGNYEDALAKLVEARISLRHVEREIKQQKRGGKR